MVFSFLSGKLNSVYKSKNTLFLVYKFQFCLIRKLNRFGRVAVAVKNAAKLGWILAYCHIGGGWVACPYFAFSVCILSSVWRSAVVS